jgi:ArsR family metal-binding transcriptional regulator
MNKVTRYILDHIDQVLNGHTNEEAKEILEELKSEIDIKIESCEDGTYN